MRFLYILCIILPTITFSQNISNSENNGSIKWNEFEIRNNKWGIYKLKKGIYHQTIFLNDNIPGWQWSTPGKSYGVLGYPMLFLGTNAWEKLSDVNGENYFKKIDDLNEFIVEYQTNLNVDDKKYNLAFDFWLHQSPKVAFETIGAEVMIWEDYNKFKPFGKKTGSLKTSSGIYDVYTGKIFKKELNKGWDYIAFVRVEKRRNGKINVMDFLNYMKSNNLNKNNNYLSSFEFGTEILTSTGNIKIEEYKVIIK